MRGLLSETVNHKLSAEGIILWVPTLVQQIEIRPCVNFGMGQLPPGGKGPRTLRCVECDPLGDDKTLEWLKSGLQPPKPPR
jgi:hypothetical protein